MMIIYHWCTIKRFEKIPRKSDYDSNQSNRKVYFSIVNLTLRNVFVQKIVQPLIRDGNGIQNFCFFNYNSSFSIITWKLSLKNVEFFFGFYISTSIPEFSNNLSKWLFIYFDLSVFDVIVWSWCSFVHKEIMNNWHVIPIIHQFWTT